MGDNIEITNKTRMRDIEDPELRKKIYKEVKEGKHKDNKGLQAIARNIIPLTERSPEEAREIRRKGAEATNKLRGERKTAKQILNTLLPLYANTSAITSNDNIPEDIKSEILKKKIDITQYDLIMLAMIKKAQQGDVKASEFVRDTFGDVVVKEVHNVNESMSQADKELIRNISERLGIANDALDME